MNVTMLSDCLEGFLALKRTMAETRPNYDHLRRQQVNHNERLLRSFFAFWEDHGCPWPIRATFTLDWVTLQANRQHPYRDLRRLYVVRAFLKQVRVFEPETEIPENIFRTRFSRRTPHLFSDKDVEKLMETALQHPYRNSLLPLTLYTLIGLLASTGLRIGEAIRLKIQDAKLTANPPHLLINETKFGKSRYVVLHPSTAQHLREYLIQRARAFQGLLPSTVEHLRKYLVQRATAFRGRSTDAFFINNFGRSLEYTSLHACFRKLLKGAGIQSNPGQRAPSIHSFRHSFAVKRLTQWHRDQRHVQELLPHLAVYLGHTGPENTYWYVTATPELLETAAALFDFHCSGGTNQ